MVENPWLSYLWLIPEMLALIGIPGLHLVRIDQCTCGTPFQKPQMWLTTNPHLIEYAQKCYHGKHEEKLEGSLTSQSSVYPEELAEKITEAWVLCRQANCQVSKETKEIAQLMRRRLRALRKDHPNNPGEVLGEGLKDNSLQKSIKTGQAVVTQMRHGALAVSSSTVEVSDFSGWLEVKPEESSPLDAFAGHPCRG